MARTCTICGHAARHAIDQALAAGESCSTLAARYSTIGRMALERHKAAHLPASVVKAAEVEDVRQALDVIKQLKAINAASLHILSDARRAGDGDLALKAVDRIYRQIEMQAKLLGDLDERSQINVLLTPEWQDLRALILAALRPHPSALEALRDTLTIGG